MQQQSSQSPKQAPHRVGQSSAKEKGIYRQTVARAKKNVGREKRET
jgi:hypothetical protein